MIEPEAVAAMVRLGRSRWGVKRIARELGVARNTVRRYMAAGACVPYRQPRRTGVMAGQKAWLRERFLQHRGKATSRRSDTESMVGLTFELLYVAPLGTEEPVGLIRRRRVWGPCPRYSLSCCGGRGKRKAVGRDSAVE